MIKAEAMEPGLVVRDPSYSPQSPTRQFFRITEKGAGEQWSAVHVQSGAKTIFRYADLERLEAGPARVFCEVDFAALIGHRVAVELKFGSTVSGVVQEVRVTRFDVDGHPVSVPTAIVVSGLDYAIDHVVDIERSDR